jgi:hypothetical protein
MRKMLGLTAAIMCAGSLAASAQVMSNDTKTNPTTNGYATSGAAVKDQHSTGKKTALRHHAGAAASTAPADPSDAEMAGSKSPDATAPTTKGPSGNAP